MLVAEKKKTMARRLTFAGFFDLQVNGFAGVDFNDTQLSPDDVLHAVTAMRSTGVTRVLPTLITSATNHFAKCASVIAHVNHPAIAGIHMEGPYISRFDGPRGAHPLTHVAEASIEDFKYRNDAACGKIKLVTLAPEVKGALELTEYLVENGIRVSMAHTAASASEIRNAIKAGATLSTHLGNGCENLLPRHPNLIWEQLAADELFASLIVDGHHLPPTTVKAMIRAKTPARTILITDAMAAAQCSPGRYQLNGLTVDLSETGRVSAPGASCLAGSAVTLDRAVANTVRFTGLPIEEVLDMASVRPASFVGCETLGEITAEWNSDTCVLKILDVNAP